MQYFSVLTSISKIGKACSQSPIHTKKSRQKGEIALEHNWPPQLFSFYYMKQEAVLPKLLHLKSNVRTKRSPCHLKMYNLGIISLQLFSQPHLIVVF